MPVSGMPLSAKLYRNALQTSREVSALVAAHNAGMHDARALAIRLYDGYNPKDGIQRPIERRSLAKLPKPLRELLQLDPKLKGSYETLLEQVQQSAAVLKSEALKAAYTELIDKWEKGQGYDSLKRKLDVAFKEKTRFHANRIAQTELARAHQDKVGAEFMADDTIDVVQVVMAPKHPVFDVCDYHSGVDLFGLGKGCYPKAKAPKPVYHPFCRCVLRSRPDLSAARASEVPGGDAAYLRKLPMAQAAKVVGGRDALQRVLNGTPLDDVLNARKDPAYHLTRLGQLDLSVVHPARVPLGAVGVLSAPMNSALKEAREGISHAGFLRQIEKMGDRQVSKMIRSLDDSIALHAAKVQNPEKTVPNWSDLDERYKGGLITHWGKEIKVFEAQVAIAKGVLNERKK